MCDKLINPFSDCIISNMIILCAHLSKAGGRGWFELVPLAKVLVVSVKYATWQTAPRRVLVVISEPEGRRGIK